MKIKILVLLIAILMVFTTACGAVPAAADNEPTAAPTETQTQAPASSTGGDTWSVFLYMCGTDLESEGAAASQNLAEIMSVSPSDKVNFIIQTGGTAQWQTEGIDSESLQRWELSNDGLTPVDQQPLASMGDAQTLGDFLSWGVQSYPADKYMVVFWNHGGGSAAGVEFDELFDNDSLSLSEVSQGLEAAGAPFEIIGFDTCLMASLENAAAISPYGRYMVASEELEPGGGWDYAAWLQTMCDNPELDGLEIGKAICDSYMAKCAANEEDTMATLSVTDLSAIPDLAAKFDAMAGEMTGVTEDITSYQSFIQGVQRAENYGGNNDDEGYTNMVDLGDLAINTENVLSQTAEALLESLFNAVKYNVKGESRSEANGLSVYFPLASGEDELTAYATTAAISGNYLRFIEAVTDWKVPEGEAANASEVSAPVQQDDYSVQLKTHITDDGYFALDITSGMESVASVTFSIYYMDYEYKEYMLLGVDNDITANWDTGSFEDNFRGVWPTINGNYCAPTLLAETDEYNLYTIPIMLNGEKTNLRAAYIWDTEEDGHFEIYGAWNGIDADTGMSAKDIIQLKDGDEVTLLFDAVNWDTGETTTYEMGSFVVSGAPVMEESELIDGEYLYQYIVTDVFGRVTYSNQAIMERKNGELFVSEAE